eukprot:CAMPEP_0180267832 /NCGR_PEP_ID=MMETSP0988-20121125/1780_1 /TAXON_ID=697907 /ORGANISM="non described non described, Strain CCMP2293" /LENGTH=105 /DNA_ID=CAMNT_0022238579 /DNA_START=991 /DNA_END=1305 /DNA_ORIENTATION=-
MRGCVPMEDSIFTSCTRSSTERFWMRCSIVKSSRTALTAICSFVRQSRALNTCPTEPIPTMRAWLKSTSSLSISQPSSRATPLAHPPSRLLLLLLESHRGEAGET